MNKTAHFLNRIGLNNITPEHTIRFLEKIQSACVLTIPYENLDILRNIPISLEATALYDKIVTKHRGVYCFELNALVHIMLSDMGFDVKSRFARYLRGEGSVPFRRHRVEVVSLGNDKYLLDIGVGQIAPRLPLKLEVGTVQVQGDEAYKFEKDSELGWVLCDLYKGEWRRYISFTEDIQYE